MGDEIETKSVFEQLTEITAAGLEGRYYASDVRTSLVQISIRWFKVLTEDERKKVARTLGGNRYAGSTYAMLEALFKATLNEHMGSNEWNKQ